MQHEPASAHLTAFCVHWELDVEATNPREAARHALDVQRNPESIATVFDVRYPSGFEIAQVDLEDDKKFLEFDEEGYANCAHCRSRNLVYVEEISQSAQIATARGEDGQPILTIKASTLHPDDHGCGARLSCLDCGHDTYFHQEPEWD